MAGARLVTNIGWVVKERGDKHKFNNVISIVLRGRQSM